MKIELLVPRVGPAGSQVIGDQIDVSDAEGARMIEAGQARPVKARETATRKNAKFEKAVE